jgi:hypothetical protein
MFLSLTKTLGMKGGGAARKSRISFLSLLMHTLEGGIAVTELNLQQSFLISG